MPLSLLPKVITPELTDLTEEFLLSKNIRLLMMDFDNTIVPYRVNTPTPKMEAWLRTMNHSRVKIAIVSNTKNKRLIDFCESYDLCYIMHAKKPRPDGLKRCMAQFGFRPEQSAIVGDQIFTDTIAGNLAGVTPILVKAIHNHNIWMKLRHVLEMPFIFAARKRRLKV